MQINAHRPNSIISIDTQKNRLGWQPRNGVGVKWVIFQREMSFSEFRQWLEQDFNTGKWTKETNGFVTAANWVTSTSSSLNKFDKLWAKMARDNLRFRTVWRLVLFNSLPWTHLPELFGIELQAVGSIFEVEGKGRLLLWLIPTNVFEGASHYSFKEPLLLENYDSSCRWICLYEPIFTPLRPLVPSGDPITAA